ncbi:glycosyl hydrolase family 28-related protein [Brucellaceae bacterium D45D]
MTARPFDEVFRDFVIEGIPASGPHHPYKPDIRDSLNALVAGPFPDNRVIKLNNANEGTPNEIIVTASVDIPAAAYQVLYILNVTQENTGPVKVTGAINRDLVTNINQPITAGYLTPGMALLCIDTGTELRLLSYGDAEAILTAAEEAAARAEAAAAGLNLPTIQQGDAGKSLVVSPDEDGYELGFPSSGAGEYESRSIVEETNVPETASFLRTAGYYAPGDGGGALYKRVSTEPSHAGKVQSADGAWWEVDLRNVVNVLQFGAKGDGVADDFQPIQNAIDAMSTIGGIVKAPRGTYNLSDGLSIIQNTVNWHDTKRVSFVGDGSGLTRFYYTGAAADKAVIDWSAIKNLDTDGTYGNSWARIGGFSVEPRSAANYGLKITAKSWFEADDIKILGAVEKNFWFRSTVSWSGRSLRSYGSKIGIHAELSDDPLAYSVPNNITLFDCTLGNSTVWGLYARNCGPINLMGGSVEGNGTQGLDASGGIYVIRNDSGIGIEAVAMNIHGTYFEHNAGGADVYVSQQSNTYPCVVNDIGANFNRVDSGKYTTNNIRLEVLGTSYGCINVMGGGFNYGGSYAPNAARRSLAITGNLANVGKRWLGLSEQFRAFR